LLSHSGVASGQSECCRHATQAFRAQKGVVAPHSVAPPVRQSTHLLFDAFAAIRQLPFTPLQPRSGMHCVQTPPGAQIGPAALPAQPVSAVATVHGWHVLSGAQYGLAALVQCALVSHSTQRLVLGLACSRHWRLVPVPQPCVSVQATQRPLAPSQNGRALFVLAAHAALRALAFPAAMHD
jgi:hypothetical protein